MVTVIVFDIGETLIDYGNPPTWTSLYRPALEQAARKCALGLTEGDYLRAIEILKRYNTRIVPRTREVSADEIFREIIESWHKPTEHTEAVKQEFFTFFRRNGPHPYSDVPAALAKLKELGIQTATLSDVAYGEDNETALADMQEIAAFIDLPLTSRDIGWRKPDSRGLLYIAEHFQADIRELIFVGNEEKDIACAKGAGTVSVLIDREGKRPEYGQTYTIPSMDNLIKIIQERR